MGLEYGTGTFTTRQQLIQNESAQNGVRRAARGRATSWFAPNKEMKCQCVKLVTWDLSKLTKHIPGGFPMWQIQPCYFRDHPMKRLV